MNRSALLISAIALAGCGEYRYDWECRADVDCPPAHLCSAARTCVTGARPELQPVEDPTAPACRVDGDCGVGGLCVEGRCSVGERCATGAVRGAEACDGLDNDCDGQTDEGFALGAFCSDGIGACAAIGVTVCGADGGTTCATAPVAAVPERCDGIDNDCDGMIDDGFAALATPCSAGLGACERQGAWVCTNDQLALRCDAVPAPPAVERCGNGIDDDCDGETDEGFERLGQQCAVGLGLCRRAGVLVCGPGGLALACSATPGAPAAESCDGLDNDCDGEIDDLTDLQRPCASACGWGLEICVAGSWEQCSARRPAAEVCNGEDDDCNRTVDDGCPGSFVLP